MHVVARWVIAVALLGLTASGASAHVGTHSGFGLVDGVLHPLTGADHVLAALAVGLWASSFKGRAAWAMPIAFVAAMGVGSALGLSGITIPQYEAAIIASLVVFGLAIASGREVPLAGGVGACALFALAHGSAHGAEIPDGVSPLAYVGGLMVATGSLHAAGLVLGTTLRAQAGALRFAGIAIALYGGFIALA